MHKNPNFEWEPVSTGNEKFMIVLSWLIVAFIVIVVGLYYGQSDKIQKVSSKNSDATINSDSGTSVAQGEIKSNPEGSKNLDKSVLGKNEVYTIVIGNPSSNFSKSEVNKKLKELMRKGYKAKGVEIDSRNQRYVIYAGKFDTYAKVSEELKKIGSRNTPASVLIVTKEVASTYLSKDSNKKKTKNLVDPLHDIISNNRRGSIVKKEGEKSASIRIKPVKRENIVRTSSRESSGSIEAKNMLAKKKKIAESAGSSLVSLSRPVSIARIENRAKKSEENIIENDEDLSLNDEEKENVINSERAVVKHGNYKLQLATFGSMKYAANYKKRLEKAGFTSVNVKSLKSSRSNKIWYVVRIEGFANRSEANDFISSVLNKYDKKIKPLIVK